MKHPDLARRTANILSLERDKVDEGVVCNWFATLKDRLKQDHALHILEDPSRISNVDETGFALQVLEQLPDELQENFVKIKSVGLESEKLLLQIDAIASAYLKKLQLMPDEDRDLQEAKIQNLFKKVNQFSDVKVNLARATYEMVDKHIRKLDMDLARFEAELKEKDETFKLEDVGSMGSQAKKKGTKKTVTKKAKRKITRNPAPVSVPSSDEDTSARLKKRFKKKTTSEEAPLQIQASSLPSPSQVLDMPVDPNEPTYCLCEQVSYGEMIGCDNVDIASGPLVMGFIMVGDTATTVFIVFAEDHMLYVRLPRAQSKD
ncbi:unnamed protein product [Darwinula stevensoni]|uniref:Inhibitor of growth protein N-terminal histone-binding domain-containing protein n=1 Tax=Darwinula stevensoni TaxID=69355 RepID=A0A7R8X4W4_9CRUS|nr:unnamed protein product [Darwinula stevensoni]CAG0886484.1 unnamed protein product [Darwinula stevensoni]